MFERRSYLSLLIGLTICLSVWHITIQGQQQQMEELSSTHSLQQQSNFFTIQMTPNTYNDTSTISGPVASELLPKDDFTNLIDLNNFKFSINHKGCNELSKQPLVVILVHSAPNNWHKRSVIRQTWGQYNPHSLLIFLVGAVESSSLQHDLELESLNFSDLVQGNFLDTYRNMTYKHVMALKWFTYYCDEVKYMMKTDDDVFINTPAVYDLLESDAPRHKLLFCFEVRGARVKRTYRSKWHVSTKEFSAKFYPNHCPGFSIIYSQDVANILYKEAQRLPYFWIDDVHITGTVAAKSNITITQPGSLYLSKLQTYEIIENGNLNSTGSNFFFTTPDLNEAQIRSLWKAVSAANNSSSAS